MAGAERAAVVSRRRLPREHGTARGYYQHRDHGDMPACQPCKDARAAGDAARRREPSGARRRRLAALWRPQPTAMSDAAARLPSAGQRSVFAAHLASPGGITLGGGEITTSSKGAT